MNIVYFLRRIIGIPNLDVEGNRLANKSFKLYSKKDILSRIKAFRVYNKMQIKYNCSLHPHAQYGEDIVVVHTAGIRIGYSSIIGNRCKLYPYCHLMASEKNNKKYYDKKGRVHPKIGSDCLIGAHSLIIGGIDIGDDVIIGAGAIVTKDVPSHSVVKKRADEIPERYKNN